MSLGAKILKGEEKKRGKCESRRRNTKDNGDTKVKRVK
jgi:hypothetical protein